ncbi:MAG: glycoside hydrolase family 15 protein, partial [Nitrospinales bacterium]
MLRMDKNRSNPLESNPDIGVGTPLRQGVLQQTDVEPSGFFPEQEADQPIENYGVIGDLHTVALIGMDGSIDWCCFPRFDSPSVFGAILDRQKGGHFKIAPIGQFNRKQLYKTDTNILITRFLHEDGVGEVTDFMPMDRRRNGKEELKVHQIVRQVKVVRGTLKFRLECVPAFDYARKPHTLQLESEGAVFESDGLVLGLSSSFPLKEFRSGVACDFILKAGETCCFILKEVEGNDRTCVFKNKEDPKELIDRTQGYWKNWLSQCQYSGRWREMVQRSALTLKMLTYEPTGAILAGPTTSLPGEIGGERNFDYRFTWIRDASFILYALLRLGFTDEADGFMSWLEARCGELNPDGSLQVMYGINGEHDLHEQELTHLSGWKKSLPIRLGNAAFNQFQLDIYGELMDSVD